MSGRKLEFTHFCARIERGCARMNSGLAAVAVVLAATTLFLSALRISDEIIHDEQLGKLPFIEMSTDGPDNGIWWSTD
ncbi:MAG TPA: hypothetical protein VN656_08780 [Stellaceae bacterium]|jgi:hypothetical protein|nr:hypothetical protein [Stellaceae bacterium]